MHFHFLDSYRPRESLVHSLDPRIKLVFTLVFIVTTALIPAGAWPVYILLIAVIVSIEVISSLGVGFVLKRSLAALPFMLAALPIIFTAPGVELASFSMGSWTITISQPGLERFISIGLKSWISIQAAIVLTASTPFPDLLVAMRAIRIPPIIVAVVGLMWRYLFVLVDEAIRLNQARASRSGHPREAQGKVAGGIVWRARVTGGMVGTLFLRAFERSDRIYMAMLSRGYDGEMRSLPFPPLRSLDWVILISGLGLCAILLSISLLL